MIKNRAFTLMEIMVVIIIVGVLAAYAIPNLKNSVQKAHERDAIVQLRMIQAANSIYKAQNGKYYTVVGTVTEAGATGMNTGLGINVIANELAYTYACPDPGVDYTAEAKSTTPAYTIRIKQNFTTPCCVGGTNCLSPDSKLPDC